MTMTDMILFVKETQTCHYVLHIATPRLCGEPGFKSRIDAEEEHYIRCREVVSPEEYERVDRSLPAAAQPMKRIRPQKKVIAPPPAPESAKNKEEGKKAADPLALAHSDVLRKALERLLAARQDAAAGDSHIVVERLPDGEGGFMVELLDLDELAGGEGEGEDGEVYDFFLDDEPEYANYEARLADILRAAGHKLKGDKAHSNSRRGSDADAEEEDAPAGGKTKGRARKPREEL